jgi:hypothetical protein
MISETENSISEIIDIMNLAKTKACEEDVYNLIAGAYDVAEKAGYTFEELEISRDEQLKILNESYQCMLNVYIGVRNAILSRGLMVFTDRFVNDLLENVEARIQYYNEELDLIYSSWNLTKNTASFSYFRHNGKRYTFKNPIELNIIETPGPLYEDGEYFDVENKEWKLRGSDTRSLEYAIEEAEYFFQFYNGWVVTTKKKLAPETEAFQKKILENIESITNDDSAPWGYVED